MKKLLFILAIILTASVAANAQVERKISTKDSLVNTDTTAISFNSVGSNVTGLQATAIKVSGTVSAKIYIQGTIDGLAWQNIDSLSLTDVATYQTKQIAVTNTSYNSYRTYCTTSGTQKFYQYFAIIRRPDER